MRVFRSFENLPIDARGAVVAIGNFDGLHLGHQTILGEARAIAERLDVPLAILSFEPHPRTIFRAGEPPFRLTSAEDRLAAASELGIDLFYEIAFTPEFASLSAEDFIRRVLVDGLGAGHIVVGWDFCFGKGRAGNVDTLKAMGDVAGFGVTAVEPVTHDNGIVYSSTAIRQALREGRPEDARTLLGRPWEIGGIVIHGDERGRTIGFPTANVALGLHLRPKFGVYAIRLGLVKQDDPHRVECWIDGVANIGVRPSFGGDAEAGLEAHLFDFDRDIYDRAVRVRLIGFIRGEQKFDGLDALKTQIGRDVETAREILAANPPVNPGI
ncbi:bifunctional riboflavin kinase/FAD synthetase [Thalassospira marina]|uniref:Riboflavin biosynthesis protein n=1 Tax=Thalassospira marina TaxID=2048283 RepID=A0A2N3KBR1_9PROT|nr:bifunctional riboflavin kinase/FAD synthetase [Thalassospira marina]AUG54049.1 riboflavin biosynthesis protein RibF [Thalassospira marina]PKR47998.1 riboflavin biosynthesis protein RibF [Thalassospira marina]